MKVIGALSVRRLGLTAAVAAAVTLASVMTSAAPPASAAPQRSHPQAQLSDVSCKGPSWCMAVGSTTAGGRRPPCPRRTVGRRHLDRDQHAKPALTSAVVEGVARCIR